MTKTVENVKTAGRPINRYNAHKSQEQTRSAPLKTDWYSQFHPEIVKISKKSS